MIGKVLASEARSAMLDLLMDGADHAAAELAYHAGVAPSTASGHLTTLVDRGLVQVHNHGRQRRFRLSGPEVARALEALGGLVPPRPASSLRSATAKSHLEVARTCYDHLAGELGVLVYDSLLARRLLRSAIETSV